MTYWDAIKKQALSSDMDDVVRNIVEQGIAEIAYLLSLDKPESENDVNLIDNLKVTTLKIISVKDLLITDVRILDKYEAWCNGFNEGENKCIEINKERHITLENWQAFQQFVSKIKG